MSLFQCGHCGCQENTAFANSFTAKWYDWTGIEDRKGKKLCSVCSPTKYLDGTATKYGKWHGEFKRVYFPMGTMRTDRQGNLVQITPTSTEDQAWVLGDLESLRDWTE